jgi:hypothetical protein
VKDFSNLSTLELATVLRRYASDIESEGRSFGPACMRAAADRLEAALGAHADALARGAAASATARSVFALVTTVCGRGGEVVVSASDMLNPACGYDARATWPDGSRNGRSERADSGMYENGQDHKADPIEALARLAAKVAP